MAVTALRASVDRRIRVLLVRQRLEQSAATLVDRATGTRPDHHQYVAHRLLLLTAGAGPQVWRARFDLARRAGSVYRSTSGVLHSNRAFGDVPETLVREWEQVARDVERAVGD